MSFSCLESFSYSKDAVFEHRLQVIQLKDSSRSDVYVSLRSFELGKPTENGICLLKAEFEKVLPFLERKEATTIKNGRSLKFQKLEPQLFQLLLIKPNQDYQVMILTDEEITNICALKPKLFKFCSLDEPDASQPETAPISS